MREGRGWGDRKGDGVREGRGWGERGKGVGDEIGKGVG